MEEGISLLIGGGTAGALITLVGNYIVSQSRQRRKIEPQPLEIKHTDEWVRCKECERIMRDNENEHRNLFARLQTVEKAVAETTGIMRGLTDRLERIDDKLDKLLIR